MTQSTSSLEWQLSFLCTFSRSIPTDMARLLNTQLRSNTGRSETWQAVCSSLHARARCVFTSPSASVNLHNPNSQLNRQPRWQPFISPSDCRQLSPTAKEWGCLRKRAKYHQLLMNCDVNSFSKSRGKFRKGKKMSCNLTTTSARLRLSFIPTEDKS